MAWTRTDTWKENFWMLVTCHTDACVDTHGCHCTSRGQVGAHALLMHVLVSFSFCQQPTHVVLASMNGTSRDQWKWRVPNALTLHGRVKSCSDSCGTYLKAECTHAHSLLKAECIFMKSWDFFMEVFTWLKETSRNIFFRHGWSRGFQIRPHHYRCRCTIYTWCAQCI